MDKSGQVDMSVSSVTPTSLPSAKGITYQSRGAYKLIMESIQYLEDKVTARTPNVELKQNS